MEQLLDFEAAALRPKDCVFKWRGIALEVGIAESTLRRFFAVRRMKLPRWGIGHKGGAVFLPLSKIVVLKAILFGGH